MITSTGRIGSLLGPAIALLLGSCSQQAPQQPATVADALPEIVARVNGVVIDRDAVLKRLEQAHSMMVHQQHDSRTSLDPAGTSGQSEPPADVPPGAAPPPDTEHAKEMLHTIINQMVLEQLKLQEVARLGLSVSHEVIEANVKRIEDQSGSPEALDQELRQGHTTREEWRTQLHQALLFQELAARRRVAVPVSDEEIRRYWDQHRHRLMPLWKIDHPEPARDRIRTLIQMARWPAEEAQWYQELVKEAKIWVDPGVRQLLAKPPDHTHPGQVAGSQG